MRRHFLAYAFTVFSVLLTIHSAQAVMKAESDLQYLPDNISYDPNVPTPSQILGAPVGTWHVRHDQLAQYMRTLAQTSDRVSVKQVGTTHENRPLLIMTFADPEKMANVEQIRQKHLDRIASGKAADEDDPLVLWMGYSVHGNEPSGANASMLVAYYLAAGQGGEVQRLLDNAIIIMEPSINPDGLSRFAQWANMHRGKTLVSDPAHREHDERWPSGRTNHYWFDLNRDWLLLTHPESRARIAQYHQWRPHVLTDFHEMGTNSTYFFQPGVPSRKHPLTPMTNVRLTEALGRFHADALDAAGALYFTEESFDDFYYGKGSTYPDAHGTIGILFEQASSRGHLQDSINGPLSFPQTIQNQVTTSMSTFAGALANKQALQEYQVEFFNSTNDMIKSDELGGYVIKRGKDHSRFDAMRDILNRHQIASSVLQQSVEADGQTFPAGDSLFVSLDQPQHRLIKSLFSTRKLFDDNTFYDVSNWNLALAFNLDFAGLTKRQIRRIDSAPEFSSKQLPELNSAAVAYAFDWHDYQSPSLLQALLVNGVQVRLAGEPFSADVGGTVREFSRGTVVIPSALKQPVNWQQLIQEQAAQRNITLWSVTSGLTPTGIDLGSRNMQPVNAPKILLVGGLGTSQYEVGEIRHYLDTRVGVAATLVDLDRLGSTALDNYTHIIFASGRYSSVSERTADKISDWVKAGGVLIGQKSATQWFATQKWLNAEFVSNDAIDDAFDTSSMVYEDREALRAQKLIAGAVYKTQLDLSHPLAYGFERTQLPMFKTSNAIMKTPDSPFITPATYTESPLMAGYTAEPLQKMVANSAAVVAHRVGQGRVIGFLDNLNFRGYWYGTSKMMSNAIYMAEFIDARAN
ncbi:M14 metallopeptidase family protein [Aestuariibacter salexigens]|uniref:M14 metallopeptidase family protein n=1 Tax=Aestuariibacter salexigens TaxID=226010 RepID=UPI0004061F69|nr:M14 metallopeptidase family protein [Aestuariibacter salexigens]